MKASLEEDKAKSDGAVAMSNGRRSGRCGDERAFEAAVFATDERALVRKSSRAAQRSLSAGGATAYLRSPKSVEVVSLLGAASLVFLEEVVSQGGGGGGVAVAVAKRSRCATSGASGSASDVIAVIVCHMSVISIV